MTIFVGDLHGNVGFLGKVIKAFPDERFVFSGDYLDSFVWGPAACAETLEKVLSLVQKKKAVALLGNHELSYLDPREHLATGFDRRTAALVQALDMGKLQPFYWEDGVLATHAGVSALWLNYVGIDAESFVKDPVSALAELAGSWSSKFYGIGSARNGFDLVGGPLWCDFNYEFEPVAGIVQVFGHTPVEQPIERSGNYCIDCIERGDQGLLRKTPQGLEKIYIKEKP